MKTALQLAKTAGNPEAWFESASRLRAAMAQLEPAMLDYMVQMKLWFESKTSSPPSAEFHSVYLMIAGLAIENLCKGNIAQRLNADERATLERGKLPRRLDRRHNINILLADVGFSPSAQDLEILPRINEALHWRGRYSVPKDHLKITPTFVFSGADDILAGNLIRRLANHVGCK
jgi:hypothetical protein